MHRSLRVLAVATEWGYRQGGVSAWNLQFCRALAAEGHSVTCAIVSDQACTTDDDLGIAISAYYGPPRKVLSRKFDLIIGHGLHTGPHAKYFRDEYFDSARYVHVQHVDHVIEHDKLGSAGMLKVDQKEDRSRALLASSDIPVGVGPRLASVASRLLTSQVGPKPVLRLDPGVPSHILDAQPRQPDRVKTGVLLVVGRADDWYLKGLKIN